MMRENVFQLHVATSIYATCPKFKILPWQPHKMAIDHTTHKMGYNNQIIRTGKYGSHHFMC